MITKIFTAATIGLQTKLIEVETDLSPSLPAVIMVGLPDKAVQESKERIRSAIKESGFEFPIGKLTINLAPADISKVGTGFDLPIAVGILQLMGYIITPPNNLKVPTKPQSTNELEHLDTQVFGGQDSKDSTIQSVGSTRFAKTLFLGELSLDGKLRGIPGVLSVCIWARQQGYEQIFVPVSNIIEARLINNLQIFGVESLSQLVSHLNGNTLIQPTPTVDWNNLTTNSDDLDESKKNQLTEAFTSGKIIDILDL